ncbi:MAG: D-Ala-D-Ala carboxypeptidase family metallohydrolase [Rikenellaceae bacterium]
MDEKLTTNFDLSEFIESEVAKEKHIDNTPPSEVRCNLRHLAVNLLQPLRDRFHRQMPINSGYRCPELNKAVGGVQTSQHQKGEAADVGCSDPKLLLTVLKNSRLTFDQAIVYPTFLHLSLKRIGMNRKQIIIKLLLIAVMFSSSCAKPIYLQGKTEYVEKVVLRDTTVYIELEQQVQRAVTKDSSRLENKTSISLASVDSLGRLTHYLEQKQQKLQKKIVYIDRIITKTDSIPYPKVIKEIKSVTKIPKFFWVTFVIAIAAVGGGVYKIIKMIRR